MSRAWGTRILRYWGLWKQKSNMIVWAKTSEKFYFIFLLLLMVQSVFPLMVMKSLHSFFLKTNCSDPLPSNLLQNGSWWYDMWHPSSNSNLTTCVTLGNSLHFWRPQFPQKKLVSWLHWFITSFLALNPMNYKGRCDKCWRPRQSATKNWRRENSPWTGERVGLSEKVPSWKWRWALKERRKDFELIEVDIWRSPFQVRGKEEAKAQK